MNIAAMNCIKELIFARQVWVFWCRKGLHQCCTVLTFFLELLVLSLSPHVRMKNCQFWFYLFISKWRPVNSWSRSKFINYGFSILMGFILIKFIGSWSRLGSWIFLITIFIVQRIFWLNQWRILCCEVQLKELILW